MGNIKITTLSNVQKIDKKFIFKDLHLDLNFGYSQNNELYKNKEIQDAVADFDYGAIKNSIFNLFNTNQGERILVPEYGLNLRRYLFEPATKEMGTLIGDTIITGITKWEPRVSIVKVSVIVDGDANQYEITIALQITALANQVITFNGVLSNSGYNFL